MRILIAAWVALMLLLVIFGALTRNDIPDCATTVLSKVGDTCQIRWGKP